MSARRPRVAIGLPVYNAERYLEDALTAILTQTLTDFELIISDNASTDATERICAEHAARDPRIRYVRNAVNVGASGNFNRTLELATAPYFKWAPYDDAIEPEFLTRCVAVLDARPEVVLCYSRAVVMDEFGTVTTGYDPGPDASAARPSDRWRNLIRNPEYCIQMMGVTRTDVLRRITALGGYPSADEVLLAELALAGPFAEVSERLYRYRRHPEQSTKVPQRYRVLFFDTSLSGRIVLPKWRYLQGCLQAVRGATALDGYERLCCYAHVAGWTLVPAHGRALAKDVLLAARQWLRRGLHWRTDPTRQTWNEPQDGKMATENLRERR